MIEAVVFDMDGVLINSEPLWRIAMYDSFLEVGLEMNDDLFKLTQGQRIDEVVAYWYQQKAWEGATVAELTDRILDRLTVLLEEQGKPMDGIPELIDFLAAQGLRFAVASSSPHRILDTCLKVLKLKVDWEFVCSAEDEAIGKPNPAVYLTAAKLLQVDARKCLVFEDSFNGVVAALSAHMKVVAMPEDGMPRMDRFHAAHLWLKSPREFGQQQFDQIAQMS